MSGSSTFQNFIDSFTVYGEGNVYIYGFCLVTSLMAILASWWVEGRVFPSFDGKCETGYPAVEDAEEVSDSALPENDTGLPTSENMFLNDGNNKTAVSPVKKQELLNKLADTLSEDEVAEERQAERQQLNSIYELMKKDSKFQMNSLEDLEEQMKLYRK